MKHLGMDEMAAFHHHAAVGAATGLAQSRAGVSPRFLHFSPEKTNNHKK
jgi:hypothetical protein